MAELIVSPESTKRASKNHTGRRFLVSSCGLSSLTVLVSLVLMTIEKPYEDAILLEKEVNIARSLFLISDVFQIEVSPSDFPGGRVPESIERRRVCVSEAQNQTSNRTAMKLPSAEDIMKCRSERDPMSYNSDCLPKPLRGHWKDVTISTALPSSTRCATRPYPKADMYLRYIRDIEEHREDLRPKWDLRGCLFFAVTVLTTIGYGHQAPVAWESKILIAVFALPAITLFGVSLSELSALIIVHVRICFKCIYRNYHSFVIPMTPVVWQRIILKYGDDDGHKIKASLLQELLQDQSESGLGQYVTQKDRRLIHSVAQSVANKITDEGGLDRSMSRILDDSFSIKTADLRRLVQLAGERQIAESNTKRARLDCLIGAAVSAALLLIGTLCFHRLEGWPVIDSFYFGMVTMTTIGLGDMYPVSHGGILFWYIWCALGLGSMSVVINGLSQLSTHSRRIKKAVKKSWEAADWGILQLEAAAESGIAAAESGLLRIEHAISRTLTNTLHLGHRSNETQGPVAHGELRHGQSYNNLDNQGELHDAIHTDAGQDLPLPEATQEYSI